MDNLAKKIGAGFSGRRVVVVGDPVADQFLHGTIDRVSREAPVFILRHNETTTLPGGAANAAANIASLGGEAVLIGVVGDDANGALLKSALESGGVDTEALVTRPGSVTTTKVRVLAGHHYAQRQQVIRVDYEGTGGYPREVYGEIREKIAQAAASADALIVSDYSNGSATPEVGKWCAEAAERHGVRLFIDSRHRLGSFSGGSATPNQEEVEELIGTGFGVDDCVRLREDLGLESLLVTRGNKGMLLIEEGREPQELRAVGSKEPVDVTGAGDSVIAAYSLGVAMGLSFLESAVLANHAGGVVVMKRGTATVTFDELMASIMGAAGADTAGSSA